MDLYRKVRPQTFDEVVGNEKIVNALKNYIKKGTLPNVMLFEGPYGCGKSTFAEIIKNELNPHEKFGYFKLNTSSFRGIDTARALQKQANSKPLKGGIKVFLMEECHNFGVGQEEKNLAQNALLDTLENCPPYTYFILCTTNASMMVSAVLSRCTRFEVELLKEQHLKKLLLTVCKQEKIKIPLEVRKHIIKAADGHARDALQYLSLVQALDNEEQMIELIERENIREKGVNDLCYALLDGHGWKTIQPILKSLQKEQPETIRRGVLGMMQSAMLNGWGLSKSRHPNEIMAWFVDKPTYDAGFPAIVFWVRSIIDEKEHPYG